MSNFLIPTITSLTVMAAAIAGGTALVCIVEMPTAAQVSCAAIGPITIGLLTLALTSRLAYCD